MEDGKRQKFHDSVFQKNANKSRQQGRYLSMDKGGDMARTARSTFYSGVTTGPASPGNFLTADRRFDTNNQLKNNQEFFRATHSQQTSVMKPTSGFDMSKLEQLGTEYLTALGCLQNKNSKLIMAAGKDK